MSLRDRLSELWGHGEPAFEMSADPTLSLFARIFADSGLYAFDANKHLRTDALSPLYDCWTESRKSAEADVEKFVVIWTPVWEGTLPVTGFRTGQDSAFVGSTPTVTMPDDERTAALLLLVTTTFVHLSASQADGGLLVQGAIETDDGGYRFVTLDPSSVQPHNVASDAASDLAAGTP